MASEKKRLKGELKRAKKERKAELKQTQAGGGGPESRRASPAVVYAEAARGVLYLLLGASLIAALVLGQRGVIISFEDIVDSLFAATAGKVVLGLIALAFVIYGLKHLRVVR